MLTLLLFIVAFVYWPGLGGGFAFDDMPNIVENRALHVTTLVGSDWMAAIFSSPASNIGRPLASLTFAANHFFTGLDPRAMKLTNLAIHLLNTVLVFGLSREILRCVDASNLRAKATDRTALFVAAFWSLNPINLMGVLYVVQRMESLSHVFVFAALWAYVALRRNRPLDARTLAIGALALVAGALLGTAAKESAVLVTLYAWCLERTVLAADWADERRRRRLRALFALLLWMPAAVVGSVLLWQSLGAGAFSGREFTLVERLMTETRVLMDYLRWTVLPTPSALGLYHDDYVISRSLLHPPATLLALALTAGLLALGWMARHRRPLAALGLLWFFSAHVLTGTFLPLELVFEHRNYFASLGVGLVIADVFLRRFEGSEADRAGRGLAWLLVLLLGGSTWVRAQEWSDPARFAASEAAKHPLSPRATYEHARVLVIASGYDRTSPYDAPAMAAIEKAMLVPGTNVLPVQAAMIFAARTGRPVQATWWDTLDSHLRQPQTIANIAALRTLTDCNIRHWCDFPPQRMLGAFSAALSRGDSAEILNIYGNYVLNVLGDPELAKRAWETAVTLSPSEPQYRANLARLLIAQGQTREATLQIGAIRRSGRLGQHEAMARSLEKMASGSKGRP